jgi:group I intron endonuclease
MDQRLKRLINPGLQRLADRPLPPGTGVIYVGHNNVNNKLYVGLHGAGPVSLRLARWNRHSKMQGNCVVLINAIAKHGAGAFDWYVIEHVALSELNNREKFWVSSDGLDTQVPRGYNLKEGGDRPKHSKQTIAKMVATRNEPEYVANLSARRKREWKENGDKWKAMMREQRSTDEARARLSRQAILQAQNATPQQKEERLRKFRAACELKRQQELDGCKTDEERAKVLKRFARTDRLKAARQAKRDALRAPDYVSD